MDNTQIEGALIRTIDMVVANGGMPSSEMRKRLARILGAALVLGGFVCFLFGATMVPWSPSYTDEELRQFRTLFLGIALAGLAIVAVGSVLLLVFRKGKSAR